MILDPSHVDAATPTEIDALSGSSRIPILFCGPLLHRLGEAFIPELGGCVIGDRPIDFHLETLRRFGAEVEKTATVDMPGVELSRLGSPWNTIRPSSAVSLQWPSLAVRQGVLDGQFALELRDVAAAIVPVRPLGSYRIEVRGDGRDVKLGLSTLSGALSLDGQGSWDRRQGLRFEAQARATDDNRVRLQSLLTLIGRREGDRTVIRIGG